MERGSWIQGLGELDRRMSLPRRLDGGMLKWIAVVTMLVDHVTCCFLETVHTADGASLLFSLPHGELLDALGRGIGRTAFPIFCFLIVEGYLHTRSRGKYLLRLLVFALLSQWPFGQLFFVWSGGFHGSVMLTLGMGVLALWIIDEMTFSLLGLRIAPRWGAMERRAGDWSGEGLYESPLVRVLVWAVTCAASVGGLCRVSEQLQTDYSTAGIVLILLFYVLWRFRMLSVLAGYLWLAGYYLVSSGNEAEIFALAGFLLIGCYNGGRGKQYKYFFYFFYPVHLLILVLIRRAVYGI